MFAFFRDRRRRRLARQPFPTEWLPYLEQTPFYATLPEAQQPRFRDLLKVFVWEKNWEGAGGFEVTDEHRVIIAANAARLVLHLDLSYYDRVRSIVIYPAAYRHPGDNHTVILGQVNQYGALLLSWQAVVDGLRSQRDGRDTTIHELAHALDLADGSMDGLPPLRERADVAPWCRVMGEQFERMQSRRGSRHILRDYGATNHAELFAVASEVFFERPFELEERRPEVYSVLRTFYGFDPRSDAPLRPRRRPSRISRNRAKRKRRRQRG